MKSLRIIRSFAGRVGAGGFGLIELMVALLIGLVMTGATLTLFLDLSRSSADMAKTNVQIENGSMAMQLLRDDLTHAGFWNGFIPEFDDLTVTAADYPASAVDAGYPAALPAPCATYTPPLTAGDERALLGVPLQLYSAVPGGCSTALPSPVAGSDVLLVRHADTCVAGVGTCVADSAGQLYLQTSRCDGEAPYVLSDSGFVLHKRNCTALDEKRRWINNIYYLRSYAVTPGDGIPTLMQSSFDALAQQVAIPMVEGVEAMRFELGVDNVGDGGPVNYAQAVDWGPASSQIIKNTPKYRGDGAADSVCTSATPCTLDDMVNTVVVKAYLLVRELEPSAGYSSDKTYRLAGTTFGPYGDAYKRHVYSTTIRLNNISGRRETP